VQHLSEDTISGFPVSPGSADALVRCGGKIQHIMIAYYLGNICAKNCRNRTVYEKIIASCKGGTFFWDTVYCCCCCWALKVLQWNKLRCYRHVLW